MENKKTSSYVWFGLFGGLLCASLVTWIAPGVIAWYFKPPAQVEFTCEAPIRWALERLRLTQLIALPVGIAAGLIVRFAFMRRVTNVQVIR